jgi:hypothetical protein
LTRKQGQTLLDTFASFKEDKAVYQNGDDEDEEDEQVRIVVPSSIMINQLPLVMPLKLH